MPVDKNKKNNYTHVRAQREKERGGEGSGREREGWRKREGERGEKQKDIRRQTDTLLFYFLFFFFSRKIENFHGSKASNSQLRMKSTDVDHPFLVRRVENTYCSRPPDIDL